MRWDDLGIDSDKLARDLASFSFAARQITNRYFKQPIAIEGKSDHSPVTIADQQAEQVIRQAISAAYPDHNIVGEEAGGTITGTIDWVIDPIDGTRVFIAGKPLFGTLIALCVDGAPVAGVIDMPQLDEIYIGVPNRQASCNGVPIAASDVTDLSKARIASTAPEALSEAAYAAYRLLSQQCLSSQWGGDCYNYALLGAGHGEIVIEHQLASHDIMALVPVIKQAGGVVTDWQGAPVRLGKTNALLATANQSLHDQILPKLADLDGAV